MLETPNNKFDAITQEKLAGLKLLLLDVDGVLTDGKITYSDDGGEIKSFSVKDGLGLRLLLDAGVKVGIITGRRSNALSARCENLGIDTLVDGIKGSKISAFEQILTDLEINENQTAFVGDDLPDLGVMEKCGISFAVADAVHEVKEQADFITQMSGGDGAVREVCEAILKAKDLWPLSVGKFRDNETQKP